MNIYHCWTKITLCYHRITTASVHNTFCSRGKKIKASGVQGLVKFLVSLAGLGSMTSHWVSQPNTWTGTGCITNTLTKQSIIPNLLYRVPIPLNQPLHILRSTEYLLTFSESKQAITRPFSTWQLFEGCANLHSVSGREQVPLWNSLHTSSVSHFVSRIGVTLTAMFIFYR